MQWHKAKVSIFLQRSQSLEQNMFKQKNLKGGRDFEIKEMGRR